MNLTDKEVLELSELCHAVVEETLTASQKARLSQWLAESEEARRFYLQTMGLSASLFTYASELQTEASECAVAPRKIIHLGSWLVGSLAAAACIVWLLIIKIPAHEASVSVPAREFVAQLTASKGCQWGLNALPLQPGDRLRKGQRVELTKGFAEITFDSGARVVLEAPASFDVNSAWQATLHRGVLKASVPPEAIGFGITNPSVEVVDLGTEFTMSADASGAAEVLVLKGEVEAKPSTTTDRQPIVLRATESRRFELSGVSKIHDSDKKLAQFSQPIALDHFTPPTDCVHWSFDETNGETFKADNSGLPVKTCDAQLKNFSSSSPADLHAIGHRQGALQFDGRENVRALFPGISKYSPHTVLFWVKVAKDAKLSTAYAMMAWGVNNDRLGTHPIHIAWNRNPGEGTVGVLRTDYSGGFAMGTTPLRDGQWHHIAVVLLPSEDAKKTMEVKQYVDGRLEGEGGSSPPGSDIFKKTKGETAEMADTFWLGCRLGINNVRSERFCGAMDELFVADRALEPQEIVQLMNHNTLQFEIADARTTE